MLIARKIFILLLVILFAFTACEPSVISFPNLGGGGETNPGGGETNESEYVWMLPMEGKASYTDNGMSQLLNNHCYLLTNFR